MSNTDVSFDLVRGIVLASMNEIFSVILTTNTQMYRRT